MELLLVLRAIVIRLWRVRLRTIWDVLFRGLPSVLVGILVVLLRWLILLQLVIRLVAVDGAKVRRLLRMDRQIILVGSHSHVWIVVDDLLVGICIG